MEMHQLRYMVAVSRTRSFSRAADQCRVSQPSLSQQIRKLEEELGGSLFDRGRNGAVLTPLGEAFLERAQRILDEADAAKRDAEASRVEPRGPVNIGVLPTLGPYLLPRVVSLARRRHPGIEMVIHEETTARLLQLLAMRDLDFAIASEPIHDSRVATRRLFAEELLLALSRTHPLAGRELIDPKELEKVPSIVLQEGHCLGDQVIDFCTRSRVRLNVLFRTAQLETIRALVSAGMGVALMPTMAAQGKGPNEPVYRSFSGVKPTRQVVAIWPTSRPPGPAGAALLATIAESSDGDWAAKGG